MKPLVAGGTGTICVPLRVIRNPDKLVYLARQLNATQTSSGPAADVVH